jgi:hypothetical protein
LIPHVRRLLKDLIVVNPKNAAAFGKKPSTVVPQRRVPLEALDID